MPSYATITKKRNNKIKENAKIAENKRLAKIAENKRLANEAIRKKIAKNKSEGAKIINGVNYKSAFLGKKKNEAKRLENERIAKKLSQNEANRLKAKNEANRLKAKNEANRLEAEKLAKNEANRLEAKKNKIIRFSNESDNDYYNRLYDNKSSLRISESNLREEANKLTNGWETVGDKKKYKININKQIKSLKNKANILKRKGNKISDILNNLNKNRKIKQKNINNKINDKYYNKMYSKIIKSNNITFIKNEINMILINSNGKTLRHKIEDYIKNQLFVMVDEGLFEMNDILDILEETYNPILINMKKGYIDDYVDCWVFLAYCVKIGNEFSIFDPNIKENIKHRKGNNKKYFGTKGFSRIYNTLNGKKINIMKKKLKRIQKENDYILIDLLKSGVFNSYSKTFNLIENIEKFKDLINNLIKSSNIVESEIHIINFIREYGEGDASFTTDKFGKAYEVVRSGGGHSFTFLFESLYEHILDYKYVTNYKNYKKFRNTLKKLSDNELENEYHKLLNYKIDNTSTNSRSTPSKLLNNEINYHLS